MSRGHWKDMVIFEFENNGRRQWCSRGERGMRGNAVPPKYFWGNVVMISGQGKRWYSSVPPNRLAKKCKVYGKS